MPIREEDVRHVALLSRLQLTDAEIRAYTEQLARILEHVEKLKALDTSKVEPMIGAAVEGNVFRLDQPRPGLTRDQALAAAPDRDDEYFRVPPVIE